MTEIKEHMSIVGKDGIHVGTVDHVEDDRIKLAKKDNPPGHEGHHHYIAKDLVDFRRRRCRQAHRQWRRRASNGEKWRGRLIV